MGAGSGTSAPFRPSTCYACGQVGHIASDPNCPKKKERAAQAAPASSSSSVPAADPRRSGRETRTPSHLTPYVNHSGQPVGGAGSNVTNRTLTIGAEAEEHKNGPDGHPSSSPVVGASTITLDRTPPASVFQPPSGKYQVMLLYTHNDIDRIAYTLVDTWCQSQFHRCHIGW